MKKTTTLFSFFALFAILALQLIRIVESYDPDQLQDFCIGVNDTQASVFVNGKICKDPRTVTADDFYYAGGLNTPKPVESNLGSRVTLITENLFPGLNTQGVAIARLDFDLNGLNPPHEHPRGAEILVVLEGTLYAGVITSNPPNPNDKNTLYSKVLNAGDIFVFPRGTIHFQRNIGKNKAVAIAAFNSQNPGVMTLGKAVFGSQPSVPPEILADGFQLDEEVVKHLQSLEWMGNAYS